MVNNVAAHGKRYNFDIEGHKLVALGFNTHLEATPIIFIHGITASVNGWVIGSPPVLADYPWYSLSLPGHFPAEFPPDFTIDELTPALIARLLATAVSQITNGQPAIIIGHSTGGFAALAIAAEYPDLVAGMVCISGFVQGTWTGVLGNLQKFARNGRLSQELFKANFNIMGRSQGYYRQAFRFYAEDTEAIYTHPELDAFIALNHPDLAQLSGDAMLLWFQKMPQTDITNWLKRITAPALILFGDCDPIVPPSQGKQIAAGIPHCEVDIFPGVGHLPTTERGMAYQDVLAKWLAEI